MCDFISWVEKKDGRLYYLTDKEIFSEDGQKRLAGCRDNDFIGHGAIRKYFHLGNTGKDHEERDFWHFFGLPKELAQKIKHFDKHWRKTFQRYFIGNDLAYIVMRAPDKWATKAWAQLLKQKPDINTFRFMLEEYPDNTKWNNKAWRQLLKHKDANDGLSSLSIWGSDKWAAKAKKELAKRKKSGCRSK